MSSQAEPEWDEAQRNWMLSLAEYRAGICPICGYPKEICQAAENANQFVANPPSRCHATTALKQFQKDNEYEHPEALVWSASIKPRPS